MLWPFIVIVILIFCIWSEDGSLNYKFKPCHSKQLLVLDTDTSTQAIDKIIANSQTNIVCWRRSLIVALLSTLIILWLIYPLFPDGHVIFIISLLIFTSIYFGSVWIQYSRNRYNDKIEELCYALR